MNKSSSISKSRVILLLLVAWACAPASVLANTVTILRGGNSTGPTAVLIVPAPPHENALGIARQIATIPLQRGTLTVVETAGTLQTNEIAGLLGGIGATGGNRPDWVWFYQGGQEKNTAGESMESPTLLLHAAFPERWARLAGEALGTDTLLDPASRNTPPAHASEGILGLAHPANTPVSRQTRHVRLLTVALLRENGMIGRDVSFEWNRLAGIKPRLIALYDAEGIGGAGPSNMERIVFSQMEDAGLYRVCGEDIREGALEPAAGSIFPGGSGRGIGNGLQAEGREILRAFISEGGGYLGICAGAYFAASGLDNYLQAIDLRHSQPWARGRGMLDIELTPEGQKLFGWDDPVLHTRYNNGPVFLPADQENGGDGDFHVLAVFKTPSTDRNGVERDEMVGEAAIGKKTFGKGRILIISPHPESHREFDPLMARALEWTLPRSD